MSDDLVKRLRAGTGDGLRAWDWMNEAADRIEELEWALQKHACDCKTCERPPEDRDDSCAANAALKGAATTEFVNVAGDVDHLIAEARREALEEAARTAKTGWLTCPYGEIADAETMNALCEHIEAAIRALKEGRE